MGKLRQLAQRLRYRRLHSIDRKVGYVVLGTEYGGWPVVPELITESSTVFGFGVGTDISFDLALIARTGCTVHAFDPTPRAGAWLARQKLPGSFHFHATGLAAEDGVVTFFAPANDEHDSFSVRPAPDAKGTHISCPVRRLESLVDAVGVVPAMVKMDIEGFEYDVITSLCAGSLRPRQLAIEFHHGMYGFSNADTEAGVSKLRAAGYAIFSISPTAHEYGFIHEAA